MEINIYVIYFINKLKESVKKPMKEEECVKINYEVACREVDKRKKKDMEIISFHKHEMI